VDCCFGGGWFFLYYFYRRNPTGKKVFCSCRNLIVVKLLTAMAIWPTGFLGLCLSLITFQFFVRLLRLIAQNVANVFNWNSGVRVRVRGCCAKDVSRGSLVGLEIV
jgi:hypothetical protein